MSGFSKILFTVLPMVISIAAFSQIELNTPGTQSVLYLGTSERQPLVVGLGGSEGGNAWASDHWKKTRDEFIAKGYAFLAIGYFGAKGTPDTLDRISIDAVHQAIETAAKHRGVDRYHIAIVGGSRGGDLALLLGSYYKDIDCVVAIVPSQAVFPGHTNHLSSPAWTYKNKPLPFVPVTEEAVGHLIQRNLRQAFTAMLKDSVAAEQAAIHVENIRGPVLLLSATNDEIAPTSPMCNYMIARMNRYGFGYYKEHIAIEGAHAEPLKHFDAIFAFLDRYFPAR